MKFFILFIFLSMHLSINSGAILHKAKKINRTIEVDTYQENYNKTIQFLKLNEGFSATVYMDKNYKAIGFGQRLAFYPEIIPDTITRYHAETILKKSFGNHLKMVKKLFPKLNKNKKLALAHISYTVGIVYTIDLCKTGTLDSTRLLKIGVKRCREFELKLYNEQ